MAIPLTVRCECGEVTSTQLGRTVTCSCGRTYDTSTLPPERFARLRIAQMKIRVYTQIGIAFVIGFAALGWILWSWKGFLMGAPFAALVWFRFLGRWYKHKYLAGLGELPTLDLEASD